MKEKYENVCRDGIRDDGGAQPRGRYGSPHPSWAGAPAEAAACPRRASVARALRHVATAAASFLVAAAMVIAPAIGKTSGIPNAGTTNPLSARVANGDDLSAGALCTPQSLTLGENTTQNDRVDDGVATWVGRDMYIGAPAKTSSGTDATAYGLNGATPTQSYAVEAEGSTLVNGKLAIHSVKDSWGSHGFRFGIVGFGSQFRPSDGSDALVVSGKNSAITLTDPRGVSGVDALGWNAQGRGWIGVTTSGQDNYDAKIAGPTSAAMGLVGKTPGKDYPGDASGDENNAWQSVYAYSSGSAVDWNQSNPMASVNISGTSQDYSDYTGTVQSRSEALAKLSDDKPGTTFTVYDNVAQSGYVRNKYNAEQVITDNGKQQRSVISATFSVNERVIKFTGDGVNPLQVFTIPASALADGSGNGVSFAFEKIPDGASVVVNVTGSSAISFHNGWRFWWAGENTLSDNWNDNDAYEIGDGYWWNAGAKATLYSTAAQSVMWNFESTPDLTVLGGQATNATVTAQKQQLNGSTWTKIAPSNGSGVYTASVSDDPGAAMIGSIMVPNGTFEDHVTTNGRVWVGQDLMLTNPTAVANSATIFGPGVSEGESASLFDMDLERHNFPWHGYATTGCAAIGWSKVNESGSALSGTAWAVYGSLADAVAQKEPIMLPTDGDALTGDVSDVAGTLALERLKPNATYFVRETNAPSGYDVNPRIYEIDSGAASATPVTAIAAVYSADGDAISDSSDQGLSGGSIVDTVAGTDVTWGKYAAGDTTFAGLAGSVWTLTKKGDPSESWDIADNTVTPTSISIQDSAAGTTVNGTDVAADVGTKITYVAKVQPADAPQKVTWSSSNPGAVSVQGGVVWVRSTSDEPVTITATSVAEPSLSASFTVTPKAVAATSLKVLWNGAEVEHALTMEKANMPTLQLTADVAPSTIPVTWSTSDASVATVSSTGLVTAVAVGTVTITASAGGLDANVVINVTDRTITRVYYQGFKGDTRTPWIRYATMVTNANGSVTTTWIDAPVEMSKACGGWFSYDVPSNGNELQVYFTPGSNKDENWWPGNSKNITIPANNTMWQIATEANPGTAGAPACATDATKGGTEALELLADPVSGSSADGVSGNSSGDVPTDLNPKAGLITVELQDGTYTLTEKTAPEGYTLNGGTYTFTVANGKVTWSDEPEMSGGAAWIADSKTAVNWSKVDASGAALAGSEWTIQQQQDVDGTEQWVGIATVSDCVKQGACSGSPYYDSDADPGKFTVEGLPAGSYRLVESKAPDGYHPNTTVYPFTVSQNAAANVGIADPVVNTKLTGMIDWSKVDAQATSSLLAGATFTVQYRATSSGNWTSYSVADCAKSSAGDCPAAVAGAPSWARDVDAAGGVFELDGLPWGEYRIEESQAPNGYIKASGFLGTDGLTDDGDAAVLTIGPGTNTYMLALGAVKNAPTYALPSTGGAGSMAAVAAGLALVGIGIALGLVASRRKSCVENAAE